MTNVLHFKKLPPALNGYRPYLSTLTPLELAREAEVIHGYIIHNFDLAHNLKRAELILEAIAKALQVDGQQLKSLTT